MQQGRTKTKKKYLSVAFITLHSPRPLLALTRCVNFGLRRAFTCKERSVLRGSFTDTGVYGFGDQRVNPEGVLMQTPSFGLRILYYVAPSPPLFHQVQGNRARCYP